VAWDLAIIGGAASGGLIASAAAQMNAKVVLIERDRFYRNPSWGNGVAKQSFLHAAELAYNLKQASRFGLHFQDPQLDFAQTIDCIQNAIASVQPEDSFADLGIETIFGAAKFIDSRTLVVEDREITARAFAIAASSRPAIPFIPGLADVGYLTAEQIFSLSACPDSLAVIGSGAVACELAQAFQRLGSQVTIIASRDRLLPQEDWEAVEILQQQFIAEGIRILTNIRIEKVDLINGKKYLYAGEQKIIADEILVAVGRQPEVEFLNLAAAGVTVNQRGIRVNRQLQTSNRHIYACGDAIGSYNFNHTASCEVNVVLQNALFFPWSKVNYRLVPWAIFTYPELARVGLNEDQARVIYGKDAIALRQDFTRVERAQAQATTLGFAKIVVRTNGEILGAQFVGQSASELIHEIVLAMSGGLKVSALAKIARVYPSLSAINSKAARQFVSPTQRKPKIWQPLFQNFLYWWRSQFKF